jgi:hypothetical protein
VRWAPNPRCQTPVSCAFSNSRKNFFSFLPWIAARQGGALRGEVKWSWTTLDGVVPNAVSTLMRLMPNAQRALSLVAFEAVRGRQGPLTGPSWTHGAADVYFEGLAASIILSRPACACPGRLPSSCLSWKVRPVQFAQHIAQHCSGDAVPWSLTERHFQTLFLVIWQWGGDAPCLVPDPSPSEGLAAAECLTAKPDLTPSPCPCPTPANARLPISASVFLLPD